MSFARWWSKANAYAEAWIKVFPAQGVPTRNHVALALAVAQHETWCGDAWPGEHNWGAVQLRGLNAQEHAVLATAGITASQPSALALAKLALSANKALGGALHIDTSPVSGPYFVWFCAFPDDETGAEKFVQVLAKNRPNCKDALLREMPTAQQLSAAMYQTGYFEGFHNPHQPGGAQANIDDYAAALTPWQKEIYEALAGWEPRKEFPGSDASRPETFDLETLGGISSALTFLGVTDLMTFQKMHTDSYLRPLVVDGKSGIDTIWALQEALEIHGT